MYYLRFDTYFQAYMFFIIIGIYIINVISRCLRIYIKITPQMKIITICDISGYTGKKQIANKIKNYYPRNKYIICENENNPTQNYISTCKYINLSDEALKKTDLVIFVKQSLSITFTKALAIGIFDFVFHNVPLEIIGKRLDTVIKNHNDFNKLDILNYPNVRIINWPYSVIVNPFMMED